MLIDQAWLLHSRFESMKFSYLVFAFLQYLLLNLRFSMNAFASKHECQDVWTSSDLLDNILALTKNCLL